MIRIRSHFSYIAYRRADLRVTKHRGVRGFARGTRLGNMWLECRMSLIDLFLLFDLTQSGFSVCRAGRCSGSHAMLGSRSRRRGEPDVFVFNDGCFIWRALGRESDGSDRPHAARESAGGMPFGKPLKLVDLHRFVNTWVSCIDYGGCSVTAILQWGQVHKPHAATSPRAHCPASAFLSILPFTVSGNASMTTIRCGTAYTGKRCRHTRRTSAISTWGFVTKATRPVTRPTSSSGQGTTAHSAAWLDACTTCSTSSSSSRLPRIFTCVSRRP